MPDVDTSEFEIHPCTSCGHNFWFKRDTAEWSTGTCTSCLQLEEKYKNYTDEEMLKLQKESKGQSIEFEVSYEIIRRKRLQEN